MATALNAHCRTSLDSIQLLSERQAMMVQVKVADRWEEVTPTPEPADANIKAHPGGGT